MSGYGLCGDAAGCGFCGDPAGYGLCGDAAGYGLCGDTARYGLCGDTAGYGLCGDTTDYDLCGDTAGYAAVTPWTCIQKIPGSNMGFAGSRRPVTAEDRFRFQTFLNRITGGQNGTLTGFSLSTSLFPCQRHSASSSCPHFIPLPTTLFNRGEHKHGFLIACGWRTTTVLIPQLPCARNNIQVILRQFVPFVLFFFYNFRIKINPVKTELLVLLFSTCLGLKGHHQFEHKTKIMYVNIPTFIINCVCAYLCMYVCMYAYIYIYIYIYIYYCVHSN